MEAEYSDIPLSLFGSEKGDSSSLCDDVASTISEVTDNLGMVTLICGTEVTREFLDNLNHLLRQHLHSYRMVMDREAELIRLNNLRRVENVVPMFTRPDAPLRLNPPTLDTTELPALEEVPVPSPSVRASAQAAPSEQPSEPTELGSLRGRSIVTSLPATFRARLEAIVGSQQQRAPGAVFVRPAVRVAASERSEHSSTRTASTASSRRSSFESVHVEDVRPADQPYFERLIPAVQAVQSTATSTVEELRSVVDFQVTSRILSSDFRTRLERVLRSHMETRRLNPVSLNLPRPSSTITPEPLPRQFVPTPHIPVGTSAGIAAPGNGASSVIWKLSNEMSVMRAQMEDLRRAMDASLAMQLEMQRLMSQEMSAVFHAVAVAQRAGTAPQLGIPITATQQQVAAGKCVVCADNAADMVFFRCGHMCTCMGCASRCKQESRVCPLCRAPIEQFVRCYRP